MVRVSEEPNEQEVILYGPEPGRVYTTVYSPEQKLEAIKSCVERHGTKQEVRASLAKKRASRGL